MYIINKVIVKHNQVKVRVDPMYLSDITETITVMELIPESKKFYNSYLEAISALEKITKIGTFIITKVNHGK